MVITITILSLILIVEAGYKRCYTCRSRGALGDCRDPFAVNSTTFDGHSTNNQNPSIEATPCASGWCAKTIEDNFADSLVATERSCMTRPPTDNEERCSETIFENQKDRKVFLCMCYGDLCNAGMAIKSVQNNSHMIYLTTISILITCSVLYLQSHTHNNN